MCAKTLRQYVTRCIVIACSVKVILTVASLLNVQPADDQSAGGSVAPMAAPQLHALAGDDMDKAKEKIEAKVCHTDESRFIRCDDVTLPHGQDILRRNHVWQYAQTPGYTFYALNVYYDNRHHLHKLRILAELQAPVDRSHHMRDTHDVFALLWYTDTSMTSQPPLCARLTREDFLMAPWWQMNNQQLASVHYTLELPSNCTAPQYVSIATSCCPQQPLTTLLKVIVSAKPATPSDKLGACIKPVFGNLTYRNASYIVSWLESMRHFGVHRAHVFHDALTTDQTVRNVFQHYVDTGFITFEHIPHCLEKTGMTSRMNDALSQSLVTPIMNDCFYRHLHDYSYTLHIDYDEILVPRRHNATYGALIARHMTQHPRDVNAVAVCARSAYFYLYAPPGSPEQPSYLPTYRHTLRQPAEIPGVTDTIGVGVRKCFQSNRHSRLMSIHSGSRLQPHEGVAVTSLAMLDHETELLIHHYRWTCKIRRRCATEASRSFDDKVCHQHTVLRQQIIRVLRKVGYFDSDKANAG